MIMVDGAEHTRLHRVLSPMFTARPRPRREAASVEVVDELLGPLVEKGRFDMVSTSR